MAMKSFCNTCIVIQTLASTFLPPLSPMICNISLPLNVLVKTMMVFSSLLLFFLSLTLVTILLLFYLHISIIFFLVFLYTLELFLTLNMNFIWVNSFESFSCCKEKSHLQEEEIIGPLWHQMSKISWVWRWWEDKVW
jgi:hypothetical protein